VSRTQVNYAGMDETLNDEEEEESDDDSEEESDDGSEEESESRRRRVRMKIEFIEESFCG
jgi:hypothetical protein